MHGLLLSLLLLPVYLCTNVGPQGLLAAALPAPFHNPPPRWFHQLPPRHESSLPWLPVSAPPTSLDECFFFISLVVGLPYSSIFCQFWLFFVFELLLSFFCCARRRSVSTYASTLAGSQFLFSICFPCSLVLFLSSSFFLLWFY